MSPYEAALAAEFLGLQVAVACHYFDHNQPDVREFVDLVPMHDTTGRRQVIAPKVGEVLTFETQDDGETVTMTRSMGA
jgi:L-ascorbate metabolism protein UlaG (beta-lactamase superfamily)